MIINGKTIAAYILLVIDVAVFFLMGYSDAKSYASYSPMKFPGAPEGMHLTFKKDIDLKEYGGDTVHFSSGTVITLFEIHYEKIFFYYSENKEVFERFKRLDNLDQLTRAEEMGVYMIDAGFDCFAEQEQLEKICEEAVNETKSMQNRVFWERFTPVIPSGLCLFVVGLLFTLLLVKKQWYVLLYVVDIIGIIVIFVGSIFLPLI